MIYTRKDGFITRKIGSRIMAVPVGTRTNDIKGMIALTQSGELLWNMLEKGCTEEEMVLALTENYEVDSKTAAADTLEFIEMLKAQGAMN